MIGDVEQLKSELTALAGDSKVMLDRLHELSQSLDKDFAEDAVPAPFHFKLILEKVQDLLEDRLLPALVSLPYMDQSQEPAHPDPPEVAGFANAEAEEAEEPGGETGRRIIPRYNQRLLVRYTVPGRDKTPQRAYSRDIGAMGLFVVANRLEKSGQTIQLEIDLPGGPVTMQGTVAWTKWVPPALRAVDYPGFAVKIHSAPERWFAYFMAFEEKSKL